MPAKGSLPVTMTEQAGQREAARRDKPTVIRTDIQALRAIAVTMVLLYHLWPNRLTGGYTGVDVFFVISGYLITAHLLLKPPRSVADLLRFWGRRIRRLLPASLLVLFTTLLASRILAPNTTWESTATHIKAAALYFVNWQLASDSVDYLAREEAATPVEHFWSLSVEEQFYLVWPVLILLLAALALLIRRRALTVAIIGLGVVVAASLAYSIYLTGTDPASAYFVTPTRMWELGIGGLTAAALVDGALGRRRRGDAVPWPAWARIALGWAGLAGIGLTAFAFSDATPFPGWQALLPVLACAAVIAACMPRGPGSPARLMALRPVQWLGDVSYSVYLWHWPLIVMVPYVSGGHLGRLDKIVVIAASLVLAGFTKVWVEDRFRSANWGRPIYKPYLLGASLMAIVVTGALLQITESNNLRLAAADAGASEQADPGRCFGAASLAWGFAICPQDPAALPVPAPFAAKEDKSAAYRDGCWARRPFTDRPICTYGTGPIKVALLGNSHAGHWLPALADLAKARGWTITTYLSSECAPTLTRQDFPTKQLTDNCQDYGRWALGKIVAGGYDLIITSNRESRPAEGHSWTSGGDLLATGFHRYLQQLGASGTPIVVIHDVPFPGKTVKSIPDCVAENPGHTDRCDGTPSSWRWYYPFEAGAAGLDNVHLIDLTPYFCTKDVCPAVIGGTIVYFDSSHITATYARTLTPYLGAILGNLGLG